MIRKFTILLLIFYQSILFVSGQSSYYSNTYSSSLYINPSNAISISSPKTVRVASNYRLIQPGSPGHIDSRYIEINSQISQLDIKEYGVKAAFGGFLNQNVQGIGKLKNTEGSAILAINFTINNNNEITNYFNAAIGPGFYSRSVDFSRYNFNDMIVSGSSISIQAQNFDQNLKIEPDVNFGISLGRSVDKMYRKKHYLIGASGYNFNRGSDLNLLNFNSTNNYIRFAFFGLYDINYIQGSGFTAYRHRVLLSINEQGPYRQSEIGYRFFVNFYLSESSNSKDTGLEFGLALRRVTPFRNLIDYNANYIIGSFGFISDKDYSVGINYDSQVGSLDRISRFNGVFEVYFTKKFYRSRKTIDNLTCPNW